MRSHFVTHDKIVLSSVKGMKNTITPSGVPFNDQPNVLWNIGGDRVDGSTKYAEEIFWWNVDKEVFASSITVIVEYFQRVGQLSTKAESWFIESKDNIPQSWRCLQSPHNLSTSEQDPNWATWWALVGNIEWLILLETVKLTVFQSKIWMQRPPLQCLLE